MRGRKPKPAALSRLDGNPGHRALKEPPKPELDSRLGRPPQWLDKLAAQEWRRVAPALLGLQLLTVVDRAALEAYCQTYSRWRALELRLRKLEKQDDKDGDVDPEDIRALRIDSVRFATQLQKFASEFGFSPASRMRLAQQPQKPDDEFESFLRSKPQNGKASRPAIH